MNAHELANALETATNISAIARLTKEEVIPMLRKQAEINNEPVAWFYHRPNETGRFMCADAEAMKKIEGQDYVVTPLYDTPQIKPLTDEEITRIYSEQYEIADKLFNGGVEVNIPVMFARAIEGKIRGEK